MRTTRIVMVMCAAVMTSASIFAGPAMRTTPAGASTANDALIAQERAMMATVDKHDLEGFKRYVKTGSWSVDENGGMSLDDFMKAWDHINVESSRLSDEKVIVLDPNAALVTYRLEQKGSFNGVPFPPVVYATTAWVKTGGRWQAIFHQESTAARH